MIQLVWSRAFTRAFKRLVRRDSQLRVRAEKTLQYLAENPNNPVLHVHKLKGDLEGVWACTVDYDVRILFEFVEDPETGAKEIFLLTLGSHDEVY